MTLQKLYFCETAYGAFYIARSQDGRFHPVYDNHDLGSYNSAQSAVEDLAFGHVPALPNIPDISLLGLPYEIEEWNKL